VERIDLLSRHLGYDPENICILAPSGDDVKLVLGRLAESGHSAIDIRDRNFDFANEGKVRVSTFHSAKGLDFPVILMFLYRPPYTGAGFDDTTQGRMMRNLIYVAATRAMDQLCVFTLAEPSAAAIRDLVECFGESDGAKLAISGAAR
jgi:DNA helicase IV